MLHPESVVIKPQAGKRYCHKEHPQENHSKNLHEINPSAGRRSPEHEHDEEGEGESRRRRISNPPGIRAAVAARGGSWSAPGWAIQRPSSPVTSSVSRTAAVFSQ